MKKILAFVSGMSPSIITETIYSLAMLETKWIADEIYVFTTKTGKQEIERKIFDSQIYTKMCQDIGIDSLPDKLFKENIIVVQHNGVELEDIRTKEDNDTLANFLVNNIHQLCNSKDSQVYVSLAGGRKTMGYYMGYALSLFARAHDKLFHVLVSEPFDGGVTPAFYYPDDRVYTVINAPEKQYQGKNAIIELAEIPFIRLREFIPKSLNVNGNFSEYVEDVQFYFDANLLTLAFDFENRQIICHGVPIDLELQQLSLYYYIAKVLVEDEDESSVVLRDIRAKDILECLNLISRGEGRSAERFEESYITLGSKDKKELEDKFYNNCLSNKTDINKKIEQKMKKEGFYDIWRNFQIQEVGKLAGSTTKLYSLKINRDKITLK